MRLALIIIGAVAACGAGFWLWSARAPAPRQAVIPAANDFFGTPKKYDTTGGQPMKPRWGD